MVTSSVLTMCFYSSVQPAFILHDSRLHYLSSLQRYSQWLLAIIYHAIPDSNAANCNFLSLLRFSGWEPALMSAVAIIDWYFHAKNHFHESTCHALSPPYQRWRTLPLLFGYLHARLKSCAEAATCYTISSNWELASGLCVSLSYGMHFSVLATTLPYCHAVLWNSNIPS